MKNGDWHCDPRTGRAIEPRHWKVAWVWVALGWAVALELFWGSFLAVQDRESFWSLATGLAAVAILTFVHWQKRHIDRLKLEFADHVARYEVALHRVALTKQTGS
jgi:hypothetical protein